jgi:outer membrane protein assembly factor BamE
LAINMRTPSTFAGLAIMALSWGGLTACTTVERPLERAAEAMTRYRAEVLQGNVITKEQVDALKPGMLPIQVRDILGTPLVQSVFHQNRWDYAYTIRRDGKTAEQRHLSVFFKDGRFERHEGDTMPSESEFTSTLALAIKKARVDRQPRAAEQGAVPHGQSASAHGHGPGRAQNLSVAGCPGKLERTQIKHHEQELSSPGGHCWGQWPHGPHADRGRQPRR